MTLREALDMAMTVLESGDTDSIGLLAWSLETLREDEDGPRLIQEVIELERMRG